jgi:hypothetical protein
MDSGMVASGSDHDECGMGEVDDAHDPPDHGEADRRDAIDATEEKTVDGCLEEHVRELARLFEFGRCMGHARDVEGAP